MPTIPLSMTAIFTPLPVASSCACSTCIRSKARLSFAWVSASRSEPGTSRLEAGGVVVGGGRRRPERHDRGGEQAGGERRTHGREARQEQATTRRRCSHQPASAAASSAGGASSGTRRALLVDSCTPGWKNSSHALGTSGGSTSP